MGKEKEKLSLCHDIIIYIGNPKDSIKKNCYN